MHSNLMNGSECAELEANCAITFSFGLWRSFILVHAKQNSLITRGFELQVEGEL